MLAAGEAIVDDAAPPCIAPFPSGAAREEIPRAGSFKSVMGACFLEGNVWQRAAGLSIKKTAPAVVSADNRLCLHQQD
jgi:hypothetical protein